MSAVTTYPKPELRAATLRKDVVYVTPRGRLCRLMGCDLERGWGYQFSYIGQFSTGTRTLKDGFWLSARNLRILRPGAPV